MKRSIVIACALAVAAACGPPNIIDPPAHGSGSGEHKFGVFNNGPLPGPGLYQVFHDTSMSGLGTMLSPLTSPGDVVASTQTLASCSSNLTDVALNAGVNVLRIPSTSGACQLLGIVAPTSSRFLWVVNPGSSVMSVVNESGSETTATNRINTFGAGTWQLSFLGSAAFNGAILLYYDVGVGRWAQLGPSYPNWPIAFAAPGLTSTSGISNTAGDINNSGGGHWRCTGTTVASLTNATCTGTHCTDCAGTITTTSTAPAVNFQATYTGASDAACVIQALGAAAAATSVAHTATQLSFTATSAGVYTYTCTGTQ